MPSTFVPPYISAGEFVKFIDSLRSRKPEWLTVKALQDIDISESNSYTLKGSLVRMGIYDDEGKLLERNDLIGLASRDENTKRETFKRILNRTYRELINAIPIKEATVEKVKDHFERKGAAAGPALKGARLFIWLANQAGFETAEVEFVPYNLEQEKASKQKEAKKKPRADGLAKRSSQLEFGLYAPTTADEEEDKLLESLQEKIRTTDGFPSLELVKVVQELIASKRERNKSHHASKIPEPSTIKESGDA